MSPVIVCSMAKKKNETEEYSTGKSLLIIAIVIIGFWIVSSISLSVQKKGFSLIKGVFSSSEAEDYCADSWKVKSAKTDYAAKKAFKSCVKNY